MARGLQAPAEITELRSFIGLCNESQRFKKVFARIAAPLNTKLQKIQPCAYKDIYEKELHALHLQQGGLLCHRCS